MKHSTEAEQFFFDLIRQNLPEDNEAEEPATINAGQFLVWMIMVALFSFLIIFLVHRYLL